MLNALLPALFLGATAFAGGPASAELSYSQAELATQSGSAAVYERVVAVAERVCADENRNSAMAATAARLCVADTIDRTITQIAAPQLTRIHAARSISPDGRDAVVLAANGG